MSVPVILIDLRSSIDSHKNFSASFLGFKTEEDWYKTRGEEFERHIADFFATPLHEHLDKSIENQNDR